MRIVFDFQILLFTKNAPTLYFYKIAPFVAGLATTCHWLPPVIFGVTPLIGAVLVLFLPETMGCTLPETLQDGEDFGKKPSEAATA